MDNIIKGLMLNLAILPVVILLILAPVCFLIKSSRFSWAVMFIGLLGTAIVTIILSYYIYIQGTVRLFAGGWKPPFGIEFEINHYNILFILTFAICGVILGIYLLEGKGEIPSNNHNKFYSLLLFSLAGFIGIVSTNDIFNFYVFLEIASISSYALVTSNQSKSSYLAAFEYLIIGSIASSFILLGIGFLYLTTGTLNMSDLAIRLKDVYSLNSTRAGLGFFLAGLILKSAFFPFHNWLGKVYQHSSNGVTAFFSVTSSNIGVFAIIKLGYLIIDPQLVNNSIYLRTILLIIAIATFIICSFRTIYQEDLKGMMANSTCAHLGYILLAISLYSKDSFISALLILFGHLLAKFAIFMIIGVMNLSIHSTRIENLPRFIANNKLIAILFIINLLFLAGFPLTTGFLGKWGILQTLLNLKLYLVSFCFIVSIFCSFIYCGKLIEKLFLSNKVGISNHNIVMGNFYWSKFSILLATSLNLFLNIESGKLIEFILKFIQYAKIN